MNKKDSKRFFLTIMLVLGTCMILGTKIFGAEAETEPKDIYIVLLMQGSDRPAAQTPQTKSIMENLTAGVNGKEANLKTSDSMHKVFTMGPYNEDNLYYIEYKDPKDNKPYTYKFHLKPGEMKGGDTMVGKKGDDYPAEWFGIARNIIEQKCSNGRECAVITYVIALNPPMLEVQKP